MKLKIALLSVVVIIIIGVVFLATRQAPAVDMDKYNNLLTTAQTYLQNKDYSEALKTYIGATDDFSTQPEAYVGMETVLLTKNLMQKAQDIADSAAAKLTAPQSAQIYLQVATKYYQVSDFTNAQKYIAKAVAKDAANSNIKLLTAQIALKLGDSATVLATDITDNTDTNFNKMIMLRTFASLVDVGKASTELDRLNTEVQDDSTFLAGISSFKVALASAKAKSTDALYIATLFAREYINAGFSKLAIAVLEPQQDKMNEYWEGLYFLGRAYYDVALYDKAVTSLQNALLVTPDSHEASLMLARTYVMQENMDAATVKYDRAISLASVGNRLAYYQEYFNVLMKSGQYSKAVDLLIKLEALQKSNWLQLAYANVYFQTQTYDKMKIHLDLLATAKDLTTAEQSDYYRWSIEYALITSNTTMAAGLLTDMANLGQLSPVYQYENGKYLFQTGKTAEAKVALQNAIEYDTTGDITAKAQTVLDKIQ